MGWGCIYEFLVCGEMIEGTVMFGGFWFECGSKVGVFLSEAGEIVFLSLADCV